MSGSGTVILPNKAYCGVCGLELGVCGGHQPLSQNLTFPAVWPAQPPPRPTSVPHQCPICLGKGLLPHGFYAVTIGGTTDSGSTEPEKCRSCCGSGLLWGPAV